MILSTRKDPPRHLALPKSKSHHPNFRQYLLHSPLPSPSLPSILPRHGKKPPRLNSRKIVRTLCWLAIFTTLCMIYQNSGDHRHSLENLIYKSSDGREYEIVGADDLPEFASPVAITDHRSKSRWTVSIPSNLAFPLPASDYEDICVQAEDVSTHVAQIRRNLEKVENLKYLQSDPNFIDIADAQKEGLLPRTKQQTPRPNAKPICEKSLTYTLDAANAGLGDTLLGLWMSYGLARREKRAFFVDDTNFAYGKFSSLFGLTPETPDCQPPPWEQRTPCPHYAKHLLVGGSTLRWAFGNRFHDKYDIEEIYAMAREGYEALFKLRTDDDDYVQSRLKDLRTALGQDGSLVGMHIRRGDRHPFEFQYQHGYLPPSIYMSAARKAATGHQNVSILVASDDADIYDHLEIHGSIRAQERISLASKKQLKQGGLGWEGGFFKDAFWSVGLPEHASKQRHQGSPEPSRKKHKDKANAVPTPVSEQNRDYRANPTKDTLQLREYVGRAYLLDLSVLAGSDEVVCGVSSKGCRILGVMLGWDRLHQGHWRNVDGDYGWRGLF